jgi:hypothetical protein
MAARLAIIDNTDLQVSPIKETGKPYVVGFRLDAVIDQIGECAGKIVIPEASRCCHERRGIRGILDELHGRL